MAGLCEWGELRLIGRRLGKQQSINETPWTQPIMASNNQNGIVITAKNYYSAQYAPFRAMDGINQTTNYSYASAGETTWWKVVFPYMLHITQIAFSGRVVSNGNLYKDNGVTLVKKIGVSNDDMLVDILNAGEDFITDTLYFTLNGTLTVGITELLITASIVN